MKYLTYAATSFVGLLLLSGCKSGDPAGTLLANDFEASVGWNDAQEGSLTTEKAHSGHWSIQVNPNLPFSLTYSRQLGRLDPKLVKSYELKAWAMRASAGSMGHLVVQIQKSATDTAKVFYGAVKIDEALKSFNQWKAITLPITLPASAGPENAVKIYVWNGQGSAPTYVDDLVLTATPAPQK